MLDFTRKLIFAMAQPQALPGSILSSGKPLSAISENLLSEVKILADNGVDGVILQNFNDGPATAQAQPEVAAYMTRLACDIRRNFPSLKLGILVCWDGPMSLAVADAAQADFVRVEHIYTGAELSATGIIQGCCREVQTLKKKTGSSMSIYADVLEPHSTPLCPVSLEATAFDSVAGGLADGLFLCGKTADQSIEFASRVRAILPGTPLILGGGSNAQNVRNLLEVYDGVCVGAWIKDGRLDNPVNPARLRQYIEAARS